MRFERANCGGKRKTSAASSLRVLSRPLRAARTGSEPTIRRRHISLFFACCGGGRPLSRSAKPTAARINEL